MIQLCPLKWVSYYTITQTVRKNFGKLMVPIAKQFSARLMSTLQKWNGFLKTEIMANW